MAKQDNNRTRVTIPVSGLDTSTPDLTVADGKCTELHNLRWGASGWRNVDPPQVKHHFCPTSDNAEWFESLTILYHHPAAGDNVYVASRQNPDGTINLLQVTPFGETLIPLQSRLNPVYIDLCSINSGNGLPRPAFRIVSTRKAASNLSVEIKYTPILLPSEDKTIVLTIPEGNTESEIATGFPTANTPLCITPIKDDIFSYQLFRSQAEAEISDHSFAQRLPSDVCITHFGNVLIVSDISNKIIHHYYLNSRQYKEFVIPAPPVVRQTTQLTKILPKNFGYQSANLQDVDWFIKFPIYNAASDTYYLSQNISGFWHGEICYFAAFKMNDGAYIAPSGLHICASELNNCSQADRKLTKGEREISTVEYRNGTNGTWEGHYDHEFFVRSKTGGIGDPPGGARDPVPGDGTLNFAIKPNIEIRIPSDVDQELIECVVLFSTRINPIFDSEKMRMLSSQATEVYEGHVPAGTKLLVDDLKEIYAEIDLTKQPFYEAKKIKFSDFTNGLYTIELSFDVLTNIIFNPVYKASQSASTFFFRGFKEYNNIAHLYDITTRLFPGYAEDMVLKDSNSSNSSDFYTTLESDGKKYTVKASFGKEIHQLGKILSYPDARARDMQLFFNGSQRMRSPLEAAPENNFAYKIRFADEYEQVDGYCKNYVKHPAFTLASVPATPPLVVDLLEETNRIQTSAQNTLFNLPLSNSYAIGTDNNRILTVNSAAIEMSDAKFGEFPLYVFTDEGIFTLQSGSGDVLYSATIPLNYDRIINPLTLAVNHNILYITMRGIQAMFSNESKLISEPLNDLDNRPPLDYLRTATMYYHASHNELVVWNISQSIGEATPGTRAYVYSIDGGYWSTRDLEGLKLNTEELVVRRSDNSLYLLDLNKDAPRPDSPSAVRLVTRPIKFGSVEFKRLETLIVRLHAAAPQSVRICIEGSNNLHTWIPLRDTGFSTTDRDTTLHRVLASVRYLRLTLEATINTGFELSQFDIEYYLRFMHRLR